jgi:hypothetical protein
VQQRPDAPGEVRGVAAASGARLEEQVADADRERWLVLLSYLRALIYHEREKPEREHLNRVVDDAVQKDRHRQEVFNMGKTIAEALMEEGAAR